MTRLILAFLCAMSIAAPALAASTPADVTQLRIAPTALAFTQPTPCHVTSGAVSEPRRNVKLFCIRPSGRGA